MKTFALALVATLTSATAAHAADWEVVAKTDRVLVESRSHAGSPVKEIRASGIINMPAWVLKNVVDDIDGYTKLIPFTTEASVVDVKGDERISHQRIEMPFLQAREYVVSVDDESRVKDDGLHVYVTAWHSASVAYAKLVSENAVRVDVNDGSWTFEELADGRTLATFRMSVDPAGALPAVVVNMAQQFTIAQYLDNLESRAKLPQYRSTRVAMR